MKSIKIEEFIKTLTLETIKNRIYTVDNKHLSKDTICNIFYKLDDDNFLQLTSYNNIMNYTQYLTNKALKSLGTKRNLSYVDFNKTLNKCYMHPEKNRLVAKSVDEYYEEDNSRIFETFSRFKDEIKQSEFNSITDCLSEKPHYKHVTYRGDSVWAKIVKVSENYSIKCKLYDYNTLEHIGYTNINNLNG